MNDPKRDKRVEKLEGIRTAIESLNDAKNELYQVAKSIVGDPDDDPHNILWDFLFNMTTETAEELLNILDNRLHPAHHREEDPNFSTEIKFPLDWSGLHDDEAEQGDPPIYVAKSKYDTGTTARAEWIIDHVKGGEGFYTFRRSSAVLIEQWTPGTSELFATADEAKARCQEIEDRLCSDEPEAE